LTKICDGCGEDFKKENYDEHVLEIIRSLRV